MSASRLDDAVSVGEAEAFFEDLAALAAAALSVSDHEVACGITIERGNAQVTVASSSARASALDEIQYEVDRGPCLHSLRTDQTVHIADLEADEVWPMWRERALASGVRSSLSVPVPTVSRSMAGGAALNFYADRANYFTETSLSQAEDFARRAVSGLTMGLRLVEADRLTENLRAALGSRSVIDQALGVIMAQDRCDADEAFRVLRQASNNRNLKMRTVAAEVVERVTGKAPVPPPAFT